MSVPALNYDCFEVVAETIVNWGDVNSWYAAYGYETPAKYTPGNQFQLWLAHGKFPTSEEFTQYNELNCSIANYFDCKFSAPRLPDGTVTTIRYGGRKMSTCSVIYTLFRQSNVSYSLIASMLHLWIEEYLTTQPVNPCCIDLAHKYLQLAIEEDHTHSVHLFTPSAQLLALVVHMERCTNNDL